ncbi:hypothetical protein [Paeniglutamicibacter psychrophenolicus]|uniref:hypothetical protein n=1 Tax=Paeniglutamicibacter psychrophenolicus TaxID=257454 RepID=UPI0027834AEC|nr:hypothetical protein [Paeniglutamicibacter psychrophenolicus]MDQ0094969.1 hypothetical protein [Paeniglutamicibacter psychrophenolicus]
MSAARLLPPTRTENFSTFLRHPNSVIEKLEQGEIRLSRRGAEDLVIARVSQDSQNREALEHLARLIAASLDDDTCDRMANSLADEYTWIEFLPIDERREFVGSYFRLLRASAKLGAFGRVTELLNSWEGTAEAYALGLEPAEIDEDFLASKESLVPNPRT